MTNLNLDNPRFPLSAVARATGWNVGTLRNYFALNKFDWNEHDLMASAPGGISLLSLRSVIRLGIAFEFWLMGVSPKEAFHAATKFADFSESRTPVSPLIKRLPCHLFPAPYNTYLVLKSTKPPATMPKDKPERFYDVEDLAVENGEQFDLECVIYGLFQGAPGSVAIVDVNRVWDRIMTALDVKA